MRWRSSFPKPGPTTSTAIAARGCAELLMKSRWPDSCSVRDTRRHHHSILLKSPDACFPCVAAYETQLRIKTTDAYASERLHASRFAKLSLADHGLLTELVM